MTSLSICKVNAKNHRGKIYLYAEWLPRDQSNARAHWLAMLLLFQQTKGSAIVFQLSILEHFNLEGRRDISPCPVCFHLAAYNSPIPAADGFYLSTYRFPWSRWAIERENYEYFTNSFTFTFINANTLTLLLRDASYPPCKKLSK
jgi:hypothetical protein